MSEPSDDKLLEDYLMRKSALSMGYRKLYIEDPPPELDRAITARARRALRWLIPGAIALVIAIGLVVMTNAGINAWMGAMVSAERNMHRIRDEQRKKAEEERARQPISVVIDAKNIATQEQRDAKARQEAERQIRAAWQKKIADLRSAGKQAEADAELAKFRAAYPNASAQ